MFDYVSLLQSVPVPPPPPGASDDDDSDDDDDDDGDGGGGGGNGGGGPALRERPAASEPDGRVTTPGIGRNNFSLFMEEDGVNQAVDLTTRQVVGLRVTPNAWLVPRT